MRSGIVFMKTQQLEGITRFYTDRVGCELWMDQKDCRIFRHGSFLFGFCDRDTVDTCGILTFVFNDNDRSAVDHMYDEHSDTALDPPCDNPSYPIYNFFARDPEQRLIEFQIFTNQPDWDALS